MTLSPGTRLGAYEILGLLGEGGMGQVYRARDARLGRGVAIKTLPPAFAADVDRLRRFEAEARAAGALNHPNVLTLYDIGTENGAPYLVSELLEGGTLRQLMASGQFTRRKTLDYASQMARGLAAAHERGIIHRDLKPENVFVTRDGRVKILDFGIAKLIHPDDAVTRTVDLAGRTDSGAMVGTVGYMSPEQVQARAVTPQSDIFAFGVVLYEMLSGKRAFDGESTLDVLNAIVKDDPAPLDRARIPTAVERIVGRCLEKDPAQRFQSTRDLAFALDAVNEGSTRDEAPPLRAPAKSRQRLAIALASVLALIAAAAAGLWLGRQMVPTSSPTFHQVTFRRGTVFSARFGPDKRTIFYSAAWDGDPTMRVFVAPSEGPESTDLQIPSAQVLATSAAGGMLVLLRDSLTAFQGIGTLAQVPLAGGVPPHELMRDVAAADFAPDGRSIAVLRRVNRSVVLEFPIGTKRHEAPFSFPVGHVRVSPRGDQIAFTYDNVVRVIGLDGSAPTVLAQGQSVDGLAWSADGKEIWYSASTNTRANDECRAVSPTTRRDRLVLAQSGSTTISDVAPDGRALLTMENNRREIAGLFPGSTEERSYSWFTWTYPRGFSADGLWILFTDATQGTRTYLGKTDGSAPVNLGDGASQALSPDGRWAMALRSQAAVIRPDTADLVRLPTRAGETRGLPRGTLKSVRAPVVWLPDSRRILFMASETGPAAEGIYLQDTDQGDPKRISSQTDWQLTYAVPPNGHSFTALVGSDPSSATAVLAPLEGGAPAPIAGLQPGDVPIRWSADGRFLYVTRPGIPAQVFKLDTTTHLKELWKTFVPADRAGLRSFGLILPTPDGKYYVYDYVRTLSEMHLVSGIR